MARKIVDATELRRGDKIVTNRRGDVETVTKPSTRESHGCVSIHADQSDILTTLPAPVKVENR